MPRRATQITLYKTGRIDPTYNNIWAFSSAVERNIWLESKQSASFTNCKYWRLGAPIRLPISYEESFGFDYVLILNNPGNKVFAYYAFITSRAYLSNNCTLFNLELDVIQTYYFSTGLDGMRYPFWNVHAFVSTDISTDLPPRGTTSEFPTGVPVSVDAIFPAQNYKLVIFSTVDLRSLPEVNYLSGTIGNSYSAALPYVIDLNVNYINPIINSLNSAGVTDAISGMYIVPAVFFTREYQSVALADEITSVRYLIEKPIECNGYTPKNKVLLGYDYTYFIVNNNQGETMLYHFEDFNGEPEFIVDLVLQSGCPTIICRPLNFIGVETDNIQRAIKITQAPSASWLNDNYKIWLAQSQNSRAASLNAAQLAIDQAYEAKRMSFAANVDGIVDGVTRGINSLTSQGQRAKAASVVEDTTNFVLNGGLLGAAGRALKFAGNTVLDTLSGVANTVGNAFGVDLDLSTNRAGGAKNIVTGGNTLAETSEATGISGADYRQFLKAAANKMMGIEQAYVYDQRAAIAIAGYNQIVASIRDHAAVPATAVGSNAYGDITALPQYGFTFITYTPSAEMAEMIDNALSASGHIVNKYKYIEKHHAVFDVVCAKSAYIPIEIDKRPEYARRLLMEVLSRGVYMWYVYNGDISDRIGATYKLDNPGVI